MTIVSTRSIAGSVGGHRRLELVAQVREVRLWVDRAADDPLDGLGRRELPAERVDVLAQPHVQPVARLVGLDADERAACAGDRAMEALERHPPELVRKCLLHTRVEPAPEGKRASDDVLPEP